MVVTLNVAYTVPSKSTPFNLAAVNAMSKTNFAYPVYEYWNFLTALDAARVMLENLHRVWETPHADSFDEMKSIYCVPTAWRDYLTDLSIPSVNIKPYARNDNLKEAWKAELSIGGSEGPIPRSALSYSTTLMLLQLSIASTVGP